MSYIEEIKKGQIFRPVGNEGAGYFMVMAVNDNKVKFSPLFWCEGIHYQELSEKNFRQYYTPYKGTHSQNTKVAARFDHERMRRLNKL